MLMKATSLRQTKSKLRAAGQLKPLQFLLMVAWTSVNKVSNINLDHCHSWLVSEESIGLIQEWSQSLQHSSAWLGWLQREEIKKTMEKQREGSKEERAPKLPSLLPRGSLTLIVLAQQARKREAQGPSVSQQPPQFSLAISTNPSFTAWLSDI